MAFVHASDTDGRVDLYVYMCVYACTRTHARTHALSLTHTCIRGLTWVYICTAQMQQQQLSLGAVVLQLVAALEGLSSGSTIRDKKELNFCSIEEEPSLTTREENTNLDPILQQGKEDLH